jgi:hypothetical protein
MVIRISVVSFMPVFSASSNLLIWVMEPEIRWVIWLNI